LERSYYAIVRSAMLNVYLTICVRTILRTCKCNVSRHNITFDEYRGNATTRV
jgi:hypothetical protein